MLVKFITVEKTEAHYSLQDFEINICLYLCVLQQGRHYQIKSRRNFQSNLFEDCKNYFFFGWRMSKKQFWFQLILRQKSIKNTPAQPPKQVNRSPRWHIIDKGHTYIFFFKEIIFFFVFEVLFKHRKGLKFGVKQCVLLDLDLNLVYFIMQKYQVIRNWNQADSVVLLLRLLQ